MSTPEPVQALRAMKRLYCRIASEGGAGYGLDSVTISPGRLRAFLRLLEWGGFALPTGIFRITYYGLNDALKRATVIAHAEGTYRIDRPTQKLLLLDGWDGLHELYLPDQTLTEIQEFFQGALPHWPRALAARSATNVYEAYRRGASA